MICFGIYFYLFFSFGGGGGGGGVGGGGGGAGFLSISGLGLRVLAQPIRKASRRASCEVKASTAEPGWV